MIGENCSTAIIIEAKLRAVAEIVWIFRTSRPVISFDSRQSDIGAKPLPIAKSWHSGML